MASQCTECHKPFIMTHTAGGNPGVCPCCDKDLALNRKHNAENENQIHYESPGKKEIDKSHKCSYCDRTFKWKINLTQHTMLHTGERPFKCCYCEMTFRRKFQLTCHMRIHTGEKPHKCSYCDMKFRTKSCLEMHIGTHTGEKPYQCKYCQKAYYTPGSRNTHQRKHNSEKQKHCCKYCENSYQSFNALSTHMKIKHTQEQAQGINCEKMVELGSYTPKSDTNTHHYNSIASNTTLNSRHRIIFGMAFKAASMAERVKPNSFKTVFNQYLLANNLPIVEIEYSVTS